MPENFIVVVKSTTNAVESGCYQYKVLPRTLSSAMALNPKEDFVNRQENYIVSLLISESASNLKDVKSKSEGRQANMSAENVQEERTAVCHSKRQLEVRGLRPC